MAFSFLSEVFCSDFSSVFALFSCAANLLILISRKTLKKITVNDFAVLRVIPVSEFWRKDRGRDPKNSKAD